MVSCWTLRFAWSAAARSLVRRLAIEGDATGDGEEQAGMTAGEGRDGCARFICRALGD